MSEESQKTKLKKNLLFEMLTLELFVENGGKHKKICCINAQLNSALIIIFLFKVYFLGTWSY